MIGMFGLNPLWNALNEKVRERKWERDRERDCERAREREIVCVRGKVLERLVCLVEIFHGGIEKAKKRLLP